MVIIEKKKKKEVSVGQDVEKLEPPYMADRDVKWHSHFGKQLCNSSKVKHLLPATGYSHAITFLNAHPRNENIQNNHQMALLNIQNKIPQNVNLLTKL